MFDALYQQGNSEQVCEMLRILITLGKRVAAFAAEDGVRRAPALVHSPSVVFHSRPGPWTARPSWNGSGWCRRQQQGPEYSLPRLDG